MIEREITCEKQETKSFPLLKNDIYQVELVDVNLVENKKYQSTEIEEVLTFEFAVLQGKDVDGGDARLRLLAKNFVPTYLYISSKKGKNWLYKVVEALIGRDLTKDEEANGINSKTLNFLIGKQCRVLLEKNASKTDATKFYSNIVNILPADNEVTSLTAEDKEKIKEFKSSKEKKDSFDVSGAEEAPDFLQPIDPNDPLHPDNIKF